MSHVSAVKPVVPKCSVPKSVPFGKSAELSCVEEEGFPKSHYQWFKNREEVPDDPKTSLKFLNSSYTLNSETGALVSASARAFGQGHACAAKAGQQGMVARRPGVGGGGYFGETVDGARGLEPRGESAVLVCTFFNSQSVSNTAQCALPLTSNAPSTFRAGLKHVTQRSAYVESVHLYG